MGCLDYYETSACITMDGTHNLAVAGMNNPAGYTLQQTTTR